MRRVFTDPGVTSYLKGRHTEPARENVNEMDDRECATCGACCTRYTRIEIDVEDEERLLNSMSPLSDKILNLPMESSDIHLNINLSGCGNVCPAFLGYGKGCGIYEERMTVCRTYEPYGYACKVARLVVYGAHRVELEKAHASDFAPFTELVTALLDIRANAGVSLRKEAL